LQHLHRFGAVLMLESKLFELELRKREEEKAKIEGDKKKIEWGSQIRSYVLQPYRMVKDHRTGHDNGNTDAVLDGDLDGFIEAFLMGKTSDGSDAELE
ncbi:MAG: peptide chain release factor-like protein, partial [Myxococcota bacterium]